MAGKKTSISITELDKQIQTKADKQLKLIAETITDCYARETEALSVGLKRADSIYFMAKGREVGTFTEYIETELYCSIDNYRHQIIKTLQYNYKDKLVKKLTKELLAKLEIL